MGVRQIPPGCTTKGLKIPPHTRENTARYLMSGIARCGVCGKAVNHRGYTRYGRRHDLYQCHVKGAHTIGRVTWFVDEWAVEAALESVSALRKSGKPIPHRHPLFDLAKIGDSQRAGVFARLPFRKRREILKAAGTYEILPQGKGVRLSPAGLRFTPAEF